ncbi:hypothetical protein [Roseibium alexandrii]|uniref:Uncharacterized protein n=1 Tax=Roseibium alexandrii (strain DSM 17067 / NCIMB 14079 / DFL-11) TaxID=244592 RepID=A0A5E8GSZ1_ROSAD|nr:hypothetical protein [Roseibium alexandrii]EEE42869.1 hypothetical protein SADFL11_PLAS41 [Roseibium alexandrii DFL-11]
MTNTYRVTKDHDGYIITAEYPDGSKARIGDPMKSLSMTMQKARFISGVGDRVVKGHPEK